MNSWTDRLLDALNTPDPDDNNQPDDNQLDAPDTRAADTRAAGTAAGKGALPWDRPPGAVADHVIVAALVGHPTRADADAILADARALSQLRQRWAAHPPTPDVIERAVQHKPLADLLTATGNTSPPSPESSIPMPPQTAARAWQSRSAYALGAAVDDNDERQVVRGDQVNATITRRGSDASATIELDYDPPLPADPGPWLARITDPSGGPFHALVVLLPTSPPTSTEPARADAHLKGVLELPAGTSLPDITGSVPFSVEQLWTGPDRDNDLAATTRSITWTPYPYRRAWERILARLPHEHPYHRPIEHALNTA